MMEMYKLILVDDEDEIRGRIASRISSDSGFSVIGSAGNGYDALELIEMYKPDIVVTDIKMPFIDGIELARIIKRDYPMTRIAFISGYDDFKYAQEAIDLKVVRYLMKPVTSEHINKFLVDLKKQLDVERKTISDTLLIKTKYEEILPIIGNSYLSSLLQTNRLNQKNIDQLNIYGINIEPGTYISLLIKNNGNDIHTTSYKDEIKNLKIDVHELSKKIFKELEFSYSLVLVHGLFFILKIDKVNIKKIDSLLFELVQTTEEYLKVNISIGVSKIYDDFKELPNSFIECKKALDYAVHMNIGKIIYANEVDETNVEQTILSLNDISEFDHLFKYGSKKQISEFITTIHEKVNSKTKTLNYEYLLINLSNFIITLADSVNVQLFKIADETVLEELKNKNTFVELFNYLEEVIFKIRDEFKVKQVSKNEMLLDNVVEYIERNFADCALSLEGISDKFNISISHLSMLLKKLKNITFNKYLITIRIDKAKEILKTTNLKIVDIASLVGYSEVYYFSHSFKKITGKSPREFRKDETI